MSISADILRSYRAPRAVVGRLLSEGPREDRALVMLAMACFLIFLAQVPGLRRAAVLDTPTPFEGRVAGALAATLFFLPLLCYGLAALSHMALRALRRPSSWHGARLALFWAMLAVSPLVLLQGALSGVLGPGGPVAVVGVVVFAAFAVIWISGLRAAMRDASSTGR
jgi:hypothetical protein